jgi:tRNA nucleotidyltransferase (CCA-adding enzyme)
VDGPDLLEALRGLPGGEELLALAPPGAYLVGGAVRDLLLGRPPRELDVVLSTAPVDADAAGHGSSGPSAAAVPAAEQEPEPGAAARLARELAARVSADGGARVARTSEHERFGTAIVEWDGGRIDVAGARCERYPVPGALPQVGPAPLAEDLRRRDFTVNAIALALSGPRQGELRAAAHALEDLRAGRLRVLHERSFREDPTRLWRLARYRARLGFEPEERTAELAAAAVAGGALGTLTGARIGAELRLALAEPDPSGTLADLERLGALAALHPRLRFEAQLNTRALELLGADPHAGSRAPAPVAADGHADRPDLLTLAGLVLALALRADGEPAAEITALLDRLEFAAGERDRVAAAAVAAPALIDALAAAARPSEVRAAALRAPAEGVALAGALDASAAAAARRWLGELRHVRLRIGGEDLLAAGVPEGPEIGRRLERVLRMRLDGELGDETAAELHAALA